MVSWMRRRRSVDVLGVSGALPGEAGCVIAVRASAAPADGSLLICTPTCMRAQAGIRLIHGSQVGELRVRLGAHRGARLRDGACARAEKPWRFHWFFHPVRACVALIQSRGRIEGAFDDRLDLDRKSTRLNSSHANISYAV